MGGGDGIMLLIYPLKTPFQYCYTLQEFMYQDKVLKYYMLIIKDAY